MRTMASLQHYLATTSGDTLYVQQFTGATLSAPLAGGVLSTEMATDYPWSGAVTLRVTGAPPHPCGLAVRAPGPRSRTFASTKTSSRPRPTAGTWWSAASGAPATCSVSAWIPLPG